jgi:hypothetical protein
MDMASLYRSNTAGPTCLRHVVVYGDNCIDNCYIIIQHCASSCRIISCTKYVMWLLGTTIQTGLGNYYTLPCGLRWADTHGTVIPGGCLCNTKRVREN